MQNAKNPWRNKGFTLVELLVVIAIIGVLIALLLPAVQAAREAARRSQCGNNLKQLVLGLHNYHDVRNEFPSGWVSTGQNVKAGWGWSAQILPFVEQGNLYDELGVSRRTLRAAIGDTATKPLLQTPLDVYRCPSDTSGDTLTGTSTASPNFHRRFHCDNCGSPALEPAVSNYVGNGGFFDPNPGDKKNNGLFMANEKLTFSDITDGTTNTIAIGERNERCRAGAWIGARNPPGPDMWGSYFVRARVSIKLNDPRDAKGNVCTEGFASSHPTGGQFAMCDGSVRFITETITFNNGGLTESQITNKGTNPTLNKSALGVYQLLGIRNDGQAIGDF